MANEEMGSDEELKAQGRKLTQKYGIFATAIYLIILPILLCISIIMFSWFDRSQMPPGIMILLFSLFMIAPISIPTALVAVWGQYGKGQFRSSRNFCFLPILIIIISYLLIGLLGLIYIR